LEASHSFILQYLLIFKVTSRIQGGNKHAGTSEAKPLHFVHEYVDHRYSSGEKFTKELVFPVVHSDASHFQEYAQYS
jgi:hypothetical protein